MGWPQKLGKRWIFGVAALVALLIVAVIVYFRSQPEGIPAYQLKRQDVTATLTVTGEVEARDTVNISPMVVSTIATITVDKGNPVRRGQVLVTLERNDVQASLREAEARVAQAQASVQVLRQGSRQEEIARLQAQVSETEAQIRTSQAAIAAAQAEQREAAANAARLRQLFSTGAISAQELDQAESRATVTRQQVSQRQGDIAASRARIEQLRQQILAGQRGATTAEIREAQAATQAARASADVIRAQLSDRTLTSPLDGVVVERLQEPGELGQPGQAILRLVDRDTLEVVAQVEENDLPRVRLGNTGLVVLDALPDEGFEAVVTEIGDEVNPENGTVEVTLQLTARAMRRLNREVERVDLLPGMTADVNIITARLKQALVVPASAVRKQGSRYYAYQILDGKISRVPIQARRISLEYYQVVSGLQPGAWVARTADETLTTKRRVKPQATPLEEEEPEQSAPPPSAGGMGGR